MPVLVYTEDTRNWYWSFISEDKVWAATGGLLFVLLLYRVLQQCPWPLPTGCQ